MASNDNGKCQGCAFENAKALFPDFNLGFDFCKKWSAAKDAGDIQAQLLLLAELGGLVLMLDDMGDVPLKEFVTLLKNVREKANIDRGSAMLAGFSAALMGRN